MKQKISILTCVTIACFGLVMTLLFRFVWYNHFWTKFSIAILGAAALLAVILQFGRRTNRKR